MEDRMYFAYGSNMNLRQMAVRCPDAIPMTPVVLHGYMLTFRGGGVATIVPKEGSKVHGLLWQITPECEQSLDRYEGYPHLYGKESVVVKDEDTKTELRVMAYIMTDRYLEPSIPSDGYFRGIMEGYRQNGIPTRPLLEALNRVKREVDELEINDPFKGMFKAWRGAPMTPKPRGMKPKDRGR